MSGSPLAEPAGNNSEVALSVLTGLSRVLPGWIDTIEVDTLEVETVFEYKTLLLDGLKAARTLARAAAQVPGCSHEGDILPRTIRNAHIMARNLAEYHENVLPDRTKGRSVKEYIETRTEMEQALGQGLRSLDVLLSESLEG